MAVPFTFFDEFKRYIADGTIDLDSHTHKMMLTNTAPVTGTNTVKADITEISAGNGYSAGGITLTSVTWAETGAGTGIWQFSCANLVITASGGNIGPFRYLVFYDDTPSSPAKPLIGMLDNAASVSVTSGNTLTVTIGANGLFRLS